MKKNVSNLMIIGVLVILNILFYTTGGMEVALEISTIFGIAMGVLILTPLIGMIYLTRKEWTK